MLKYVDIKGNEVTEIAAREGIEQILAIREYLNNLMVFLRDTTELSEEQIKEFDNTVRDFNNTLDYCSPKGEEVRIDPDTYLKLQRISMELMTICGKEDESYYYEKGVEYASEHQEEAIEMGRICYEIHNKYELLKEA